jgi:tyrosyl-tRNA synthetase
MNSDIEIGGTDQKFNLLMGRTLQKAYNSKKQQAVLMMPILEGLDGVQKMSKSLGNYIGVTDEPFDMFGKILSISDELMWRYFELLSSKSLKEIEDIKNGVANLMVKISQHTTQAIQTSKVMHTTYYITMKKTTQYG